MRTKSFGSAWKVSAAVVARSIHECPPNFEDSSIGWSLPARGRRKIVSVFGRQTLTVFDAIRQLMTPPGPISERSGF
jgi:hypothetical protein